MYPAVFFDASRVKIREDAVVRNKASRAVTLITVHLHKARTRVVVNGHMRELPARPGNRVPWITRYPVARTYDAPELLGVHEQELSGAWRS